MPGWKGISKKMRNIVYEGLVFAGIGASIFFGKAGCEYISEKATWKYVVLKKGDDFVVKEPVYEGPFGNFFIFTGKPGKESIDSLLRNNPDSVIFKMKDFDSLVIFYHPIEYLWGKWCGYYSTDGSIHLLGEEMGATLRHELYHKWQSHGQTAEEFSKRVDIGVEMLKKYLEGKMEPMEREVFESFWRCYFDELPDGKFYTNERLDSISAKVKEMRRKMSLDDVLRELSGWKYNFALYIIELEANSRVGDFELSE
ncbi:MAG: hypothetical protein QXD51_04275 [Candidatus Anstonellales archaeon]